MITKKHTGKRPLDHMGRNVSERTTSPHGENQWVRADEGKVGPVLTYDNQDAVSHVAVHAVGRGDAVFLACRSVVDRARSGPLEQFNTTVAPEATETDERETSSIPLSQFRFGAVESVAASFAA